MTFQEFYILQEIGNIQELPTTDISDIEDFGDDEGEQSYVIHFQVEGEIYSVVFTPHPLFLIDRTVEPKRRVDVTDNCWGIDFFSGETGTERTNLNVPHQVYTKMLLAIKKFFSEKTVDAIIVQPAESKMKLVYNRFLQKFLPDFVRIQVDSYISKSFIETLPEPTKELVLKEIERWSQTNEIDKVKREENEKRNIFRNIKNSVGKLLLVFRPPDFRPQVGLVKQVSGKTLGVIVKPSEEYPQMTIYPGISNIRPISQMTPTLQMQIKNLQQLYPNKKLEIWKVL